MLCGYDRPNGEKEGENTFQLRQRMYFAPKYILENKVSIKKIIIKRFYFCYFSYKINHFNAKDVDE